MHGYSATMAKQRCNFLLTVSATRCRTRREFSETATASSFALVYLGNLGPHAPGISWRGSSDTGAHNRPARLVYCVVLCCVCVWGGVAVPQCRCPCLWG